MKKLIVIACFIVLFGCAEQEQSGPDNEEITSLNTSEEAVEDEVSSIAEEKPTNGYVYERKYFGTVYITTINDDRVNIRDYPSLDGQVVSQMHSGEAVVVTGISDTSMLIADHNGYWLRISHIKDKDYCSADLGWVFSKFVTGLSTLSPETITFIEYNEPTDTTVDFINIKIGNSEFSVCPHKEDSQDFFSFVWSDDWEDFNYSHVPGIYIWYPETNEIKHITYYGSSMESAWVVISDDFRYAIEDGGTSPGYRGLGIYDISTNEHIFSGRYYEQVNLSGYEVDIVYPYTDWLISRGDIDEETDRLAKAYLEENPVERRTDGLQNVLLVKYRFNFIDQVRTYTGCEVIVTQ